MNTEFKNEEEENQRFTKSTPSAEAGPPHSVHQDRVERMAREMQQYYSERLRAMWARATEVPRALAGLTCTTRAPARTSAAGPPRHHTVE